MVQTSFGAFGSVYSIRFHHIQAHAWIVAGFVVLQTGCLQTARVFTEPPTDTKMGVGDGRYRAGFPGESADPGPGPSAFLPERPLTPLAIYSEEYWLAVAQLDLTALHTIARTEPELGFAEGISQLAAGAEEKAESTFLAMSRQAIDVNVAVAAQMMLATTLLYEHKWTTLRDLSINSSLAPMDREHTSDLEHWGHAFASVEPSTATFPEKPVVLHLGITDVGTPTVRVRINGKEHEFWLDTGSSMTVLSSDVAADANVRILSLDTLNVRTFEGVAPVMPSVLKRMEIGKIVFANTPIMVMDASLMRLPPGTAGMTAASLRVDGIIGWDVIRQLDILMDYQRRTITIGRPEHLSTSGTSFRNLTWLGKPLVEVRAKLGGTFHFTLDTGAQSSFLNVSTLDKLGVTTVPSQSRVFGIAGTGGRMNRAVPGLTLEVAGTLLRLENVIVYGPPSSGLINCDGILGSDIAQFGSIRIDATNGLFSVGV